MLADSAIGLVCNRAIQNKNYEQAQRIIDHINPLGIDKRILQANLYQAQKEWERVSEIYEGMVYQDSYKLVIILQQLLEIKYKNEEFEETEFLLHLIQLLVEKFELNEYLMYMNTFNIACYQKDKQKALSALQDIVETLKKESQSHSYLYKHCNFKKEDMNESVRMMLKQLCEKSKDLDFLRDEPKYKRIYNQI